MFKMLQIRSFRATCPAVLRTVCIALIGIVCLSGCPGTSTPARDYREEMRNFVIRISTRAREVHPGFIIIPQNGQELLTTDGTARGPLAQAYAAAIDGQGREDLLYGYDRDNVPTAAVDRNYLLGFLERDEEEGIEVLVTDYCSTPAFKADSYAQNAGHGFISYAADHRELDNISARPAAPGQPDWANNNNIGTLADARNFLYLINPGNFANVTAFIDALAATNYDVLLLDLFFNDTPLTLDQVNRLKIKANGGRRLVVAYMSIGEAEDYRYYWQASWRVNNPSWIEEENPDFAGNYKVQYWRPEWQDLILSGPDSYLNRILSSGFDGVYLDLIDAFEYFER